MGLRGEDGTVEPEREDGQTGAKKGLGPPMEEGIDDDTVGRENS